MQNGEQVYAISKTLSEKTYQAEIDDANRTLASLKNMPKVNVGDTLPFLTIVYVRKQDYIIVGQEFYSKRGDLISSQTYSDVRVNVPLDDNLFKVPKSHKVITANTPSDLSNAIANQ